MKNILRMILVGVVGFALSMNMGCAAKGKHSGFLKDYPKFKPGKEGGVDLIYLKENVDFKSYDKIMLDHVVFYFSKDAKYRGIHTNELQELADAFHKAMADALKDGYPLVEEPGPGVLRIRCAITDVVATRSFWSTDTTVTSEGLEIKRSMTKEYNPVGGASMEMELLDALTNGRVAAAIDTKAAGEYEVVKGLKKWGHAEDTFEFWAKKLRKWLDEVHGE
jgi:Protein of unknown function (DUF3313)